jgi:hypothetical protein
MLGFIPFPANQDRSRSLLLALRIFMIILALNALCELAIVISFKTGGYLNYYSRMLIMANGLIAIGRIIGYIVLIVLFIMWMRRAYNTLHIAGSRNLHYSEGWAAGAWFVPIINFFYPLQIMRDIWHETQNVFRKNGEVYEKQEDNITGWWWALWLLAIPITWIANYALRAKDFETGYLFSSLSTLGYLFDGFLVMIVIKRISAMELDMMDRAQQYYAWVTQQQSAQYQQQQEQQQQNPVPQQDRPFPQQDNNPYAPKENQDRSQDHPFRNQDDFYKPKGPDSTPPGPPPIS